MSEHPLRPGAYGAAAPSPAGDSNQQQDTSLGDLFSDLSHDVTVLVSQEIELAKAELRAFVRSAGKGAGFCAGAGIAGLFVLLFLSLAAVAGLAVWIGFGYSALVVAVVWALVATVLAAMAKKQFSEIRGLPQTTATIKAMPRTFNSAEEMP